MISATPGGVTIEVRVIPRAARAGVAGSRDGALLVRLNAPPVEGAANAELVELMAGILHVPRKQVTIVAGEKGRRKRVRVEGVTEALVRAACRLPD
jgi:hypothetical protein